MFPVGFFTARDARGSLTCYDRGRGFLVAYSFRSATIGSTRDARRAGK